jgi:hypothetical protein
MVQPLHTKSSGKQLRRHKAALLLSPFLTFYATAQIAIVNPSFEGGPTGASITPPPWLICTGTVDTEPCCGGSLPASHGTRYLGIWDSAINPESTGQQLGTPLVAGTAYTMSMDMYKATGDGWMDLYGGSMSCATTQLMWSSPPVSNTSSWVTYTATFVPTGNWDYIRFNTRNNLAVGTQLFIDNISSISTVPIKLFLFNAKAGYKEVVLSWASGAEDVSHFIVERSTDGAIFSELIPRVKATDRNLMPYTFTDPAPPGGVSYYRLKQANVNGSYTYSHIVKARPEGKIRVRTAVAHEEGRIFLSLEFPADLKNKMADILLSDISGRPVYAGQLGLSSDTNILSFDSKALRPGIYILGITCSGLACREKIVIH